MKTRNNTFTTVLLALGFLGILPGTHAVVPAPDGGYPGGNTAEGQNALFSLTTGGFNTAVGFYSLGSNTTAPLNTAVGAGALFASAANTADQNTAIGAGVLLNNTSSQNTGVGAFALVYNTTGFLNTAIGHEALFHNTSGILNTALGDLAGVNVTTASNVICIGATAFGENVDDSCWVGNIYGVTTQSATTSAVVVSDTGQLGTVASSLRFKKDISSMDKASETILSLRPVTFHYRSDTKETPQFGLIAEEVAKVNPSLVLPDKEGKPYTVKYDAVNAMLLNEFLKQHRKVEDLEAKLAKQQKDFQETATHQQKQIETLTQGLQRVSAQLEMSRATPNVVCDNP